MYDVDQGADRMAQLEARVAELEAAQITPGFVPVPGLQIAADGTFSYNFHGDVVADSLTMDAGAVAPSSRLAAIGHEALRWLNANGQTMGFIYGFAANNAEGLNIEARPTTGINKTQRTGFTLSRDPLNGGPDGVVVFAHPAGIGGSNDTTEPQKRLLLDGAGASDFMQSGNLPQGVKVDKYAVSNTMAASAAQGWPLPTPPGATVVHGVVLANVSPASHWSFGAFGNHVGTSCQLVTQNNSGSPQGFTIEVLIFWS